MTAEEKTTLAQFFDLAAGSLGSGWSRPANYDFADDPPPDAAGAEDAACVQGQNGALTEGGMGEAPQDGTGDSLQRVAADISLCTSCPLCKTRTNAVPGEGAARPLVMVIGEGPGADEDKTGRPFVGKAGQLLDKMLAAIGLSRQTNCFIANVVKCRPPGNRDPWPQETAACSHFLVRQINLLQPKFILCVGRISAQTLLKTQDTIGKLRSKFWELRIEGRSIEGRSIEGRSIPLFATYHPSALLHSEEYKRPAWEDLKMLKARLDG